MNRHERLRLAGGVLVPALVVGVCGEWWGVRPLRSQIGEQERAVAAQMQTLDAGRRQLLALPLPEAVAARTEIARQQSVSPAFNVLAFVQLAGGQLVSWKPSGNEAELLIDLEWEQVPGLFAALARFAPSRLTFSLAPHEEKLRLALQLAEVPG